MTNHSRERSFVNFKLFKTYFENTVIFNNLLEKGHFVVVQWLKCTF